jgi:hypothetical protein
MTTNLYPLFNEVTPDQYNDCVKYFLDTEVNAIIKGLTPNEKDQFFEMHYKFPQLLDKLFYLKGAPFTNFVIYGNEFYDALKDHHEGIDFTPSWIVAEFKEWMTKNNIPFPEDLAVKQGLDLTPMVAFQANLATQ